jgi:hypothetical protein
MWPFLDEARGALGLNDAELDWLHAANIRSFDALHAMLLASPSLATHPAIRRNALVEALSTGPARMLLSERYRGLFDAPVPDFPLMPLPAPGTTAAPVPVPVPNWPAPGGPAVFGAADPSEVSLLGALRTVWAVRDQMPHSAACVGFAVAAAMERVMLGQGQGAPAPLSALFVYQRIPVRFPKDPFVLVQVGPRLDGPTRLSEAAEVLRSEGICPRPAWPDTVPPNARPGGAEVQQATVGRRAATDYWDLDPTHFIRPDAVARVILDLLQQGRPVAVTLPEFRDPAAPPGVTNWRNPYAYPTGIVGDRPPGWVIAPSGHAVCILGFVRDLTELQGGWFIFRNSWGVEWGGSAPDKGAPVQVPRPGYGAMSARHAQEAVWEILAPPPA